jgi:adenosylhomocysteine nucleosidase
MTPVSRLGIIAAMDEEFSLIADSFGQGVAKKIGPRDFLSVSHQGLDLVLVRSRIGKVAAASAATLLLHEFECDALLFTGVAGGVHSSVGIGDIVVAEALVQHDMDIKGVLC